MSSIEPNLMAGKTVYEWAVAQPLHAGGPIGLQHCGTAGLLALTEIPQGGDGCSSILNLMRTWQARHGQIQKTGLVLIDQAPHLSGDMPMLPIYAQIGANFCRLTFDHLEGFLWLGPNNCGDTALQNARFFKGTLNPEALNAQLILFCRLVIQPLKLCPPREFSLWDVFRQSA